MGASVNVDGAPFLKPGPGEGRIKFVGAATGAQGAYMSSRSESGVSKPLHFGIVTVPRAIIGTAILAGIAINFANVIGRYVFLEPVIWAEEIMIYIMVWTVFLGAVLVSFEGQHLKMDFFSIMLPSPYKETINFISTTAILLICLFVIPNNWTVVKLMWDNDQRSVVAEIPMVIPHFALLLGFVLIFIAILVRFRSHVTGALTTEVAEIVAEHEAHIDSDRSEESAR